MNKEGHLTKEKALKKAQQEYEALLIENKKLRAMNQEMERIRAERSTKVEFRGKSDSM